MLRQRWICGVARLRREQRNRKVKYNVNAFIVSSTQTQAVKLEKYQRWYNNRVNRT